MNSPMDNRAIPAGPGPVGPTPPRIESVAPRDESAHKRGRVLRRLVRNPSGAIALTYLSILGVVALFAPLFAPKDPNRQDLLFRFAKPSSDFWLGTDDFGRDQLSRLVFGARVSLLASFEAVGIGGVIGITLGLFCGFAGGRLDGIVGRIIEVMMALPGLLVAITVLAVLGPGLTNAMLAVGLLLTPPFFRVARAATQDVREETYIEGSRALGCTTRRMILHHVLPNMIAPVVVQITVLLGLAITIEASLSFIGLGVQAPTATWGSMLSNANSYLATAPHLVYVPGLMIAITVLAFSMLGDALARALGTTRTSVSEKQR